MSENGAIATKTRYAMVVDQRRCIGCHACVMACKAENNVPLNYSVNVVITEGSQWIDIPVSDPDKTMGDTCTIASYKRQPGYPRNDYMTRSCQHCVNAPCVKNCPTGATWQREDGIVAMDTSKCIGCEICMQECVYGYGQMRVLLREPKFVPDFRLGDQLAELSINNTVKKCTFCAHRIDKGQKPFCVEVCPARARYFGDLNNSGSDIVALLSKRDSKQFEPETGAPAGVLPQVYFLKP